MSNVTFTAQANNSFAVTVSGQGLVGYIEFNPFNLQSEGQDSYFFTPAPFCPQSSWALQAADFLAIAQKLQALNA